MSIHESILDTTVFPIHKCAIFCRVKEIKELCGDVRRYVAQTIPPIDAEIAKKGHLWMETRLICLQRLTLLHSRALLLLP